MYTILTGGAGFIGANILRELNNRGEENIIVVDNLEKSQKWNNLVGCKFENYFNKHEFYDLVADDFHYFGKIKQVIHMGACSATTEENMDYLMDNNLHYSQLMFNLATEHNAVFIYASSAATYGDGALGFEDDAKLATLRPINRYGFSKHLFDLWLDKNDFWSKAIGLKFFNVFGPFEYHKGSMVSMAYRGYQQILDSGKIKLFASNRPDYEDGGQKRDFVYVKDCARVVCDFLQVKGIGGLYNMGTGFAHSWNELAGAIFSAMGQEKKIKYIPMPENLLGSYQYFTKANMNKLRTVFPDFQATPLQEAVRDYVVNYLRKN